MYTQCTNIIYTKFIVADIANEKLGKTITSYYTFHDVVLH
jgi:hypothetical protein